MCQNDLLDFIVDTDILSLEESYEAIFNFDNCIDLCPPPSLASSSSSSVTTTEEDDLDNTIIKSLMKTEQRVRPKKNAGIIPRRSLRKKTFNSLFTILRSDPKKRGLSKTKYNKIKDRIVVTAKKSVVTIAILPKTNV
jgi:hypothetical protein